MGKKINYRIHLASNFQVVEFNLELDDENEMLTIEDERIFDAVQLVNKLGQVVENTIKTKEPTVKSNEVKMVKEELATPGQLKCLKYTGFDFDPITITKKEADILIKKAMNK